MIKINKKKLIAAIIIFFATLLGLIYLFGTISQALTSTKKATPGVITENNTEFIRSMYKTKKLQEGENVYILKTITKNNKKYFKVKYKLSVGLVPEDKVFFFDKTENTQYSLMSDVSSFDYTSGRFKTQGEYELFIIKNNIRYVYIRAGGRGYTEGKIYYDNNFKMFRDACEYLKIPYGFYFIDEAINQAEAEEEANVILEFLKQNKTSMNKLPFVIDLEYQSGKSRTDALWPKRGEIITNITTKLNSSGIETLIYANAKKMNANLIKLNQKFWVAYYTEENKIPTEWLSKYKEQEIANNLQAMSKVIAWQFSETGAKANNITQKLDLSLVLTEEFEKYK